MTEKIIYSHINIKEKLWVLLILAFAFMSHAYNMFHYPYFENDEGTYMSQAWSLLKFGSLAPYTYWYDHAPAGWLLIASWVKATGGIFAFGPSVYSGRVLMLVLHIGSSFLLYYIAKKLNGSSLAGGLAIFIFSLSPLGVYFQRRVLLDNIMIFWVLLALAILIKSGQKLSTIFISALVFGVSILTKENAFFFIPTFLYVIYLSSGKHQREFLLAKWLLITSSVVSLYFLYALLKGELFPVGFMGDTTHHVSLITTLQNQFSRGEPIPFWDPTSDFYENMRGWIQKDPVIMIGGFIATVGCLIIGIKNKAYRIPALLTVSFLLFLARGKLVIDFYIIPLIPLFALCMGMVISYFVEVISMNIAFFRISFLLLFLTPLIYFPFSNDIKRYTNDETTNQIKTLEWIKKNIPPDSQLIIDAAIYVDLHDRRTPEEAVFPNADWVWKVEQDSEIYDQKLQGEWSNVQFIILSHEMLKQIREGNFILTKKALANAYKVRDFTENLDAYIDIPNFISTNGDWMAVYKVKDKNKIMLDTAWEYYKSNFIKSYGKVVDLKTNNTTSEGQSYALLRAVMQHDKETFDRVWQWTKDHMQHRIQDNLISWLWLNDENEGKLGDTEAATDGDTDIALALLMANKQFKDPKYLMEAQKLISDIWNHEVVEIDGQYFVISGPGGEREDSYLVNPSYFSPAHYRLFARVDPENDWNQLADDSYVFLNTLGGLSENTSYLPQNWVLVDKKTGELKPPQSYVNDINSAWYGFDAFRVMWRVYLDKKWFNSPNASVYLSKVAPFFEKQVDSKVYAIYSLDGMPRANYSSLSPTTGAFFALAEVNRIKADELYIKEIEAQFKIDEGYWGEAENYYDQNWAWFATALYSDYFTNPWE